MTGNGVAPRATGGMPPATATAPAAAPVTVVVPLYNDRAHVADCLRSVLAQDYPREACEVLVVDGGSTDGSLDVVRRLAANEAQVRLLHNPGRIVSTALNIAIAAMRGRYLVRVDSHTLLDPDYVRRCVEVLEATGAANVGGPMRAVGDGAVGTAMALATSTTFGIGNSRFHYETPGIEAVESVYLGAFRREVFDAVGTFDEALVRDQDDEFNYRLRLAGETILLVPAIRSRYHCRRTLGGIWRQYFGYGYWKVAVIAKHRRLFAVRHLVPAAFVLSVAGGLPLALLGESPVPLLPALLYAALDLGVSAWLGVRAGWRVLAVLPLVFAAIHGAYGAGFLGGLVALVRRRFGAPRGSPGASPR